ncbi:MAG: hypothetical protein V1775_15570 [Bacteroidota bacterium]
MRGSDFSERATEVNEETSAINPRKSKGRGRDFSEGARERTKRPLRH